MRKLRKSKAYLIVSSAYLGVSEDIVRVFAQAASYYGAEVFHLGPTISEKEAKQYNKHKEKLASLKAHQAVMQNALDVATEDGDQKETKRLENELDKILWKIAEVDLLVSAVVSAERERIDSMVNNFGSITAITAPGDGSEVPDMFTRELSGVEGVTVIESGKALSKYMYLSAVPPSSERTTAKPITKRSMDYLKQYGKYSWVVAHPVPAVETMEKPGLNNAHKFYTVGSMRHLVSPRGHKQFFRGSHLPCAMMLLIDENGEYHAKQMHIDYIPSSGGGRPCVIDDGLVFLSDRFFEVEESDKGCLFTDDHAPYTHPGTLGAGRYLNYLHRPAWLVNNGDAADFTSISPHTLEAPGERENLRLEDDIMALRKLFDAQDNVSSIKHRILIDSNHHEWVSRLVSANPWAKNTFDWHTLAKTRFPDWEVYIREAGDNKIFRFGDYIIRHGDKESIERGSRMSESGKYACGHHHRYYTFRRAMSIGCGSGLGPKFIGNQVTAWVSQITSMTKYKGIAALNPKIVLHDERRKVSRFAYRSEVWEVDFHEIFNEKSKREKKGLR